VPLLISFCAGVNAQIKKGPFYQTSLLAGPALPFYQINSNHMDHVKAKPAFTASVRGNFRINRTASVILGLQYLYHGNSFNSYYFPDSTVQLYDKNFNYTYESRFQDLSIPLGIRIKLTNKKQKESCIYTELIWAMKRRFASNLQVNSSLYGNSVYDDDAGSIFTINKQRKPTANTVSLGFGFDKNFPDRKSGWFIGIAYTYVLNTFYFSRTSNMPKSLYQNESFAALTAGVRF
jgi:hypothetical protein